MIIENLFLGGAILDNTLINLFSDYKKTQEEYTQAMSPDTILPNWDSKRLGVYINGVVIGKYREKDAETLKVIHSDILPKEIKRVISSYYKDKIKELSLINNKNVIQLNELKRKTKALEELENINLECWIKKYENWIYEESMGVIKDTVGLVYIFYAYKEYNKIKNSLYNSDQDNILKAYNGGIDKMPAFSKYGLLPIDDDRELMCIRPPRIYDRTINKTLFLKNIPINVANKFYELLEKNVINEISVRVSNNNIFDHKYSISILLEEVERGNIFSFLNIGICDVTKLYSKNFGDCLWIIIDKENITFEEMCDDFDVYDDKIITQVIHLQYRNMDKDTIITHLDHEYIFYTEDEYSLRIRNPRQKGEAAHRIKSFKIDKSRIPFTYPCNVECKDNNGENIDSIQIPFIYFVLENYFKHKDLLKEYFQKILNDQ